ncbi:MAG: DUF3800 domain-containing protein [Desulfobacula sp.]|jgi:hypothetical protein
MNIDVYCDEAYPDLFSSSHPQARYLVIGSIWINNNDRNRFKEDIHNLRDRHKIGGEFKWTKVSPSRVVFYKELLTWFHNQGENLRFRCIAIDQQQVNLIHFHQSDQELGFYKFYYQMLHHWIHPFNHYQIFCDFKNNRLRNRLHTLKVCLGNANLTAIIDTVQSVRSNESVFVQLADVITGLASAKLNNRLTKFGAKEDTVIHLEDLMGYKIAPTALSEKKFNVFKINLHGGW